ncbi:hypothetical protein [Desertibaculum subflavum]|uniref:hypothetical protein n=1 Tax=Desertibaculum subflavum TaxID=2268458 RepID=UPI0013C4FF73
MFDRSAPPPCPRIGILADAATLVKFRPGKGRDLTDVEHEAEVFSVDRTCELRDKGAAVEVVVTIQMAASRGPAAPEAATTIALPYFVAVVERASQRIVARESIPGQVELPPGRRRAGVGEEITERIPLAAGRSPADYEILVGLELTEEQLEYNRRRRGY